MNGWRSIDVFAHGPLAFGGHLEQLRKSHTIGWSRRQAERERRVSWDPFVSAQAPSDALSHPVRGFVISPQQENRQFIWTKVEDEIGTAQRRSRGFSEQSEDVL